MPVTRTHQPIRAGSSDQVTGARIAIELAVCQDTPSSAAIVKILVPLIINRRNTYRDTGTSSSNAALPAYPS